MKLIFTLSLLATLPAFAALNNKGYSPEFKCFNPASMNDSAPYVTIVTKKDVRFLEVSYMDGPQYLKLEGLVKVGRGVTEYDTVNYNVMIGEGFGAGAKVIIKGDTDIVYKCEAVTAL